MTEIWSTPPNGFFNRQRHKLRRRSSLVPAAIFRRWLRHFFSTKSSLTETFCFLKQNGMNIFRLEEQNSIIAKVLTIKCITTGVRCWDLGCRYPRPFFWGVPFQELREIYRQNGGFSDEELKELKVMFDRYLVYLGMKSLPFFFPKFLIFELRSRNIYTDFVKDGRMTGWWEDECEHELPQLLPRFAWGYDSRKVGKIVNKAPRHI